MELSRKQDKDNNGNNHYRRVITTLQLEIKHVQITKILLPPGFDLNTEVPRIAGGLIFKRFAILGIIEIGGKNT